jgi:hypothetical protein
MSQVPTDELRPLPVAPRPFDVEVLSSWIGRLASRYRITVSEFAARHELVLQIDPQGGWLTMPAIQNHSVDVLAAITRIERERIMEIHVPQISTIKRNDFCYCARCVFLNPLACRRRSQVDPPGMREKTWIGFMS